MLEFIKTFEIGRNRERTKFYVFFKLWRYEVYIDQWEWLSEDPLIQKETTIREGGCYDLEMWIHRLHVLICKVPPQGVFDKGESTV